MSVSSFIDSSVCLYTGQRSGVNSEFSFSEAVSSAQLDPDTAMTESGFIDERAFVVHTFICFTQQPVSGWNLWSEPQL